MSTTFEIAGQIITVYQHKDTHMSKDTFVYLHTLKENGSNTWQQCTALGCPPCTLVSIEVPDWGNRLTPWECAGLFAEDPPFEGHAEKQLSTLQEIAKETERRLSVQPSKRCIAGYSLAGLFAAWAPFQTNLFNAVVSASGSLWYPGFPEYARQHNPKGTLEAAYFSLGTKEAKTPSRLLRNVAKGTEAVRAAFEAKGVPTFFEKNPGNHFKEPDLRMAKGICWTVGKICSDGTVPHKTDQEQ